jgi:integrase
MNSCIRFYRHCSENEFIGRDAPKWKDRSVVIKYHDAVGFERALSRFTTDISIKCRTNKHTTVEDGLLPITGADMGRLLEFAKDHSTPEMLLMLKLGFLTGARVQTICGLKCLNLERAVPDKEVRGLWHVAVGPGSQPYVATKFDVSGNLLIPEQLLEELKTYAYSVRRMKRAAIAAKANRDILFITSRGNPYEKTDDARRSSAINSAMVTLRRRASSAGLRFMNSFHFHQTRATYGTQLMSILLPMGNLKAAIEFVRIAMFHREIATTMTYVKFIEHTKGKIEVADAYTRVFFGVNSDVILQDA